MKRRDLAQQYFPESSPRAAVKALLRWIDNCPELVAALEKLNIPFRHKINLTARQVRIIMYYLGDPEIREAVHNWLPCSVRNWLPCSVHNWLPCSVHNWLPCSVRNWMPDSVLNWLPCHSTATQEDPRRPNLHHRYFQKSYLCNRNQNSLLFNS